MWLPRNMLLRLCGRIVAKGTYAENTLSPEKKKKYIYKRNGTLRGERAAGNRSWRGFFVTVKWAIWDVNFHQIVLWLRGFC